MNTKEMLKQFGLPIGYKRWCFNEKDGTQDLLIVTSQGIQRFASIKDDVGSWYDCKIYKSYGAQKFYNLSGTQEEVMKIIEDEIVDRLEDKLDHLNDQLTECEDIINGLDGRQIEEAGMSECMTAKKMFESLGYALIRSDNCFISYEKNKIDALIRFVFVMKDKKFYSEYNVVAHDITMDELKAVNKQIEELGWL